MLISEYARLSRGGQDWTEAFAAAIEDIRKQGGGELTVPSGTYKTGSIRLCSHLTLNIQAGAVLDFIPDEQLYPPIDLAFEGINQPCHQSCLFAQGERFITLKGEGTINGNGSYWWKKFRNGELECARPYLICLADCTHVRLMDLHLTNSPVWTVHPLRCRDVLVENLLIENPYDSPNTDGIDPDSCSDVRIMGCVIDVGDDCISVKCGTEDTPSPLPSQRVIISGCMFLHGHGGVVLGSEMSGGIRDVLVSDCVFRDTDRGIRLKTRRGRGGRVEDIRLTNLMMDGVMCPFVFNMFYFCGKGGKSPRVSDKSSLPVDESTPYLGGVRISNVSVRNCTACAGYFYGLPESPVEGVTFRDVTVRMAEQSEGGHPAMMEGCEWMTKRGFFLRNARGVSFEGTEVFGVQGTLSDMDESVC